MAEPAMEERRSELTCRVCGDKASGKHYGVPSCDGCRGFFKRSIRRCRQNLEYVCKESGRCLVDVARRNQCQACRFTKCLQVNMRREAVQHERAPRSCVKRQPSFLPSDGVSPLLLSSPMFPPFAPYAGAFPHLRPFPLVPPPFLGSCAGSAFTPVRPAAPFWLPLEPIPAPALAPAPAPAPAPAGAAGAGAGAAARQPEPPQREDQPESPEPARSREEPVRSREEPLASQHEEQEVSSSQIDVVRVDSPPPDSAEEAYQARPLLSVPTVAKMAETGMVRLRAEHQSPQAPHPCASLMFRTPSDSVLETAAKLLFLAVRWAHTIPSFIQMSVVEQRALLEASWSELFVISAAQWPLIIDNPFELAATSGSPHPQQVALQLAALADIVQRFADLKVDHTEYACLRALVLFKPGETDLKVDHTEYACLRALVLFKPEVKSVHDSKYIEVLQDQTHLMLYEYVFSQKVAAKARFGRLLLLLSSLRTVSSAFLQEAFFRRALGGIPISHLLADLNGNSAAI